MIARTLALLGCLFTSACATTSRSHLSLPTPAVVNDVRVEITGVLRAGAFGGVAGFQGLATNTSSEPLQFCTVTLDLADAAGVKVGQAMATTQHIAPGGSWKFDAYSTATVGSSVERVQVVDVTTNKSLFTGFRRQTVATGAPFNQEAAAKLTPGITTLPEAEAALGSAPTATSRQADGSALATWSHVVVQGTDIHGDRVEILFDSNGRMVRIVNQSKLGNGTRATVPVSTPASRTSASAAVDRDALATRIEHAIQATGEQRAIAGAATDPFSFSIELHRPKADGTFEWMLQETSFVHCVAGNMYTGVALYRVGLVAGEPRIVVRGALRSKSYEVVWESWPDGLSRAGSPAPKSIEFDH